MSRKTALSRTDWLWMFAGLAVCLLICCVFTRGRIFWEDEMLGWMLVHDPSWNHMVAAWKAGADGGGFLFYLLGRAWFAVFGGSNVSFRLISAVCFGLAFCVTWAAGRRFYGVGPVALGLFNTWFFSPPMVIHMAEGRFYGLLVLTTSLVMWLVLDPVPGGDKRPGKDTAMAVPRDVRAERSADDKPRAGRAVQRRPVVCAGVAGRAGASRAACALRCGHAVVAAAAPGARRHSEFGAHRQAVVLDGSPGRGALSGWADRVQPGDRGGGRCAGGAAVRVAAARS